MEEQDVPNARDEIRKLQEALKRNGEDPGSADESMARKTRGSRQESKEANGIHPGSDPDEQAPKNFAAGKPTQANAKT
jgi:hypothetical protein